MRKLNLFLSVLMAVLTPAAILILMYYIPFSFKAMGLLSSVSVVGYLAAAIFYKQYKSLK